MTEEHPAIPRRYNAYVIPVARGADRWSIRLRLTDGDDKVLEEADLDMLVFLTRTEADTAGWRIIEDWVHGFAARRRGRERPGDFRSR